MSPDLDRLIRASLLRHEGLMLSAYDDGTGRTIHPGDTVKGWVTIGYGRNLVGKGITTAEAEYLLANDLASTERELDAHFPGWRRWTQPRQWALLELGYNLGAARFATTWPNTAAHLRAGRFRDAATLLAGSKWRRQVGDGRALKVIRAIDRGTWI